MQSSTGQYSTQAGEPAQPVQFSLIMARMRGLRLRLLVWPSDFGSSVGAPPATYSSMLGAVELTIRPWLSRRPSLSFRGVPSTPSCLVRRDDEESAFFPTPFILADPRHDVNALRVAKFYPRVLRITVL